MNYIEQIRKDFPVLNEKVKEQSLVYLDNAATTQKPRAVIESIDKYYSTINANVHRGVHFLSECATEAYEQARTKVQNFINAKNTEEIIFVRGSTEAINLVASSFGAAFIKAGDEVVITEMEHHSNIVPWQLLCERNQAKLRVISLTEDGEIDLSQLDSILNEKTKIVAVSHVSNSLGSINPVKQIIDKAHSIGVPVLIDGAQAGAHLNIDVQELDCDFYTLSSHKMFGPMGIGALYGKKEWLEKMPPYQGGGEMILQVTFDKVTYNNLPYKFEAGTPSVGDAIAWGIAIDYLQGLDREKITQHEADLLAYANNRLQEVNGIKFYGTAKDKVSIVSFLLDKIHPHDMGTIVNDYGVAIRTGHHCNMPLMNFFGISGTARASFAMYNTLQDVDRLVDALHKVQRVFHES